MNVLNSFVIRLIKAAVVEREHRIQHERWEREQEEKERRRRERQRLKEAEERKLWGLFTDAICWHRSQQIRAYIQAVKDKVEKTTGDIVPGSSLGPVDQLGAQTGRPPRSDGRVLLLHKGGSEK